MMGAIPNELIKKALMKPAIAPTSKDVITDTMIGIPCVIMIAAVTAVTPIIEPTDRSIPLVSIIKVIPTEHIPTIDTCLSILNMFRILRKFFCATKKMIINAIHANNMP
jgi:hypothetical protein